MALMLDVVPPLLDLQVVVPLGIAAVVLVLGLLVWRARRSAPKPQPALPAQPAVPLVVPKVELPPSELEARKRSEGEEARRAAQEAARERLALEREAKGKDETGRAALDAQVRVFKEKEEDAKKEAYRAQKVAEAEAKDRRQREREEGERLKAEAEAMALADAEALKARALVEQQTRTQAQAGQTLAAGQMQVAKFAVPARDAAKAEVFVSVFPSESGGTLANVNRWRRQLGLEAVDEEGLKPLVSPIEGAAGAQLVDLKNDAKAMLGAIVPRDGRWWFYKLMGDAPAVNAEREAFIRFVQTAP